MKILHLSLKAEYFNAIKDGSKLEEFRLVTNYWQKRLVGRHYDAIEFTLGYPKADDMGRRLFRPFRGFKVKEICHPFFGPDPVMVFALPVNE